MHGFIYFVKSFIKVASKKKEMVNKINLLWTLSIEDDILVNILKRLDPVSLQSLEASCSQFQEFIQRRSMWKVLFNTTHPSFLENIENYDIFARVKKSFNWDDHYKFKRLCLKLHYLEVNWQKKNWNEKSLSLQSVFKNEVIKAMDTNLIVSVEDISFFSSLGTVFDLAKWKKEQHLQEEDKMHILSAHISQKNLVLFGEP